MSDRESILALYRAFNARDLDTVLAHLQPDVLWPNGWQGGWLRGRAAVREYWTRQWGEIDPTVEPIAVEMAPGGEIRVTVRQVVRSTTGAVQSDTRLRHEYIFREGLIARMEIRGREAETDGMADREFVHLRTIDAPRERVFEAFRDPVLLARWWGPNGFSSTFKEFDFRTGGAWRLVMQGPDGADYANESVFVDVRPPERLVIEHVSDHHFLLTITLVARDGSTVVKWRQVFDTATERARIADVVIEANEQNLDRLAAVVVGRPSGVA